MNRSYRVIKLKAIDSDLQVAYWHTVGFPLPKYLQEFATALGPS